ncbi:hypothetical protein OJF2_45430 [Aquisphaera giovannonii]|uniref:Uncharacterized protein n=1 Tax=Aquisphaera giovannonii TaxID=406548 RepID=A0A5B9W7C1_9BACT|nr:hypothetical protein [Aquisphaera giovannonii]QEH35985.1 hypothetical protein OJF2_45430 [Aquisphaera giovannonii]
MALRDWFSRRTPLQAALDRGTRPGGDLAAELNRLEDYTVTSRADAEAICRVLERVKPGDSDGGLWTAFHSLVGLFQDVEGPECPAFDVLAEKGNGLLAGIVNEALDDPSRAEAGADDILFALKILALYGTEEGTDAVLRAARLPLRPDAYMWSVILHAYSPSHPELERVLEALGDPPPADFLAVSLLDCANVALREGAECRHPFDSEAGRRQLRSWLADGDEEHSSYAVSAAAALPFLDEPGRDELLAAALDHPSADVQLEAAWAAARLEDEDGIRRLSRCCLDVNLADRARRYLEELDRADAIPAEAEDAAFRARAEFAQWLAHPNELGRPPDEVEVVDHRELEWPPERERGPFWLVRYRVKDATGLKPDDVGVGLVGSMTFCLFTYKLEERPPEDCYAIHCYWEMTCHNLIEEADVADPAEYESLLQRCRIDGLGPARVETVVELSPELKYPQRLVGLGRATRHDRPGWVVVDGPRSRWYAADEMPAGTPDKLVVMVHVGRELLGFRDEPDRRRYLKEPEPARPPEEIDAAYEALLEKAGREPGQAERLFGSGSVLTSAFNDYAGALSATRSLPRAACVCLAYESILDAARRAESSQGGKAFDVFSPLGGTFDSYVDALIELGRRDEVPALVETFRPHWDHNLGRARLAAAAFRSGHDAIAEPLLLTLRTTLESWGRDEAVAQLAAIWKRQGRADEAHALFLDALKGLVAEARQASGSDRDDVEEWLREQRSRYLDLFPERGEAELERLGIPPTTRPGTP